MQIQKSGIFTRTSISKFLRKEAAGQQLLTSSESNGSPSHGSILFLRFLPVICQNEFLGPIDCVDDRF